MKKKFNERLKDYLILLNSIPTPCLVLALNYEIVARNQQFTETFSDNEVLNKSIDSVFSILKHEKIEDGAVLNSKINDCYYQFVVKYIDLESFKGFLIYIVDGTALHNKIIEKDEKFDNLSNLVKVLFHDLRSPISGILGMIDLVNLSTKDQQLKKMLMQSNAACWSIIKSLDSLLLWYSYIQNDYESNKTIISLDDLIDDVFKLYSINANNKDIDLISDKKGISIITNAQMLNSVIGNLVSNAIKFSNLKSRIIVSYRIKDNNIQFFVKDTGAGISEKDQQKIFSENVLFSTKGTAHEHGFGFGLKMVNNFIQKLGGEMWCVSTEGQGTTFKFTLPYLL